MLNHPDQLSFLDVIRGDEKKEEKEEYRETFERVKREGEDFEWYPTTKEMLAIVAKDIKKEFESDREGGRSYSILDIGAGNGSALKTLCELTKNTYGKKYAIEKSKVLLSSLPPDVFIIGTDFHQQTLIDKQVDVIFNNPPYSEFEEWMRRITTEANCQILYFVVPKRWKENVRIKKMIERRCKIHDFSEMVDQVIDGIKERSGLGFKENEYDRRKFAGDCEVLGSMTFEESEYRKARAEIEIVKIKFKNKGYRRDFELEEDPFDIWFDEYFPIKAEKQEGEEEERERPAEKLHNLVKGVNIIDRLEELYQKDFERLLGNYHALEGLDYSLFKELGVDLKQLKGGLKSKISGLKNLYWRELFDSLDAITNRLTGNSRKSLLETLTAHTSVDFTSSNAYAVVIWAIKNANEYFDKQLTEVYLDVTDQEAVRNYKSNKRVVTDEWRYARREWSHYTLDYRIILKGYACFSDSSYSRWEYPNGLKKEVNDRLNDLCTVAKNLGFDVATDSLHLEWAPGKMNEFLMREGSLFMDVRAYKNGNIHIRCNQDFMRKFNVEAGRLNGWVKSPIEAKEEMDLDEAPNLYGSNYKMKSIKLIEG